MGDLRNKIRKLEQEEAHKRWLEKHCPRTPDPPLPRCLCGLTYYDTIMVAHQDDRWSPTLYFCPACYPPHLEEMWFGRPMCNLYSVTKAQKAIIDLVKAMRDLTGNMPSLPAIFPNGRAPVVRIAQDGVREMAMLRWGFPPPNIPGTKPRNPYLTNVRNTDSRYWRAYLNKLEHRCLVPVTSFAEPDNNQGKRSIWTWFAQDETRPLMFFAGIWREWEGDRGTKAAPDVGKHQVFSFLTTDASPDVAPIHPDATPVLLLDEAAREMWLNAPIEDALALQRPPPAGALKIVAIDTKEDPHSGVI